MIVVEASLGAVEVPSHVLGAVLAAQRDVDSIERSLDGRLVVEPQAVPATVATIGRFFAEHQRRALMWTDREESALGDARYLSRLASALDSSWRRPDLFVVNEQWSHWCLPIVGVAGPDAARRWISTVSKNAPGIGVVQVADEVFVVECEDPTFGLDEVMSLLDSSES